MSPAAHELPPGAEKLNLRPQPEFDEENDNHRLAGYVSQDGMQGYLLIEKKQAELGLEEAAVLEKLRAGGLVSGVDPGAVRQCLARAVSRGGAQLMEVARGAPADDGLDGQVEFYVQPSSEEARYTRDAAGRVNYHELNLIENVAADQEVARLLPPKPGAAGSTVLGEELPPRVGEPARARAGTGIKVGPGGDSFVAEIPGRLVCADEILSISQEYEVKGNVDYSVGNIDFVGRVTVSGEVLDDFNVRAEMGLEVRGPVGSCQLASGGDVVLASGMSGKTRGNVKTAKGLRARYLNEVSVEAEGDVSVEREAYNSVIRTGGVYQSAGKVVGGEVTALKGIEVGTAGSELGVATKLIAGVDFRRSGRIRELNEKTAALDKEIERVSAAIGPLLADPKKITVLPADKKKVVLSLVSHLRAIKEKREGLAAQAAAIIAADTGAVRQINIKEKLWAGVTVEVGSGRMLVRSPSTGPLSLVEEAGSGTVRIEAHAPLGEVPPPGGAGPAPAPAGPAPR